MLRSHFVSILILSVIIISLTTVDGQVVTRTRTRTRTRIIPGQTRTITLSGGQLLTIDSRTLQRLQNQGVDINNLQNLSEAELEELGITIRTDTISIPGAVTLEGGIQQITLKNGVILTIDQETLKRLQSQGVDINTLPSLSEVELQRLGIVLTTETISTTRLIPGSTRTITLSDGQIITIEYETLLTLQEQGVDIDNLQALSEEELERLGLITTTRRITVARPRTGPRTQTTTTTRVTATSTGRRTGEDEEGRAAPQPPPAPRAPRPSPRPRARPQPPPPPPPASGTEPRDDEEPAPEPYDFSYTAENDDGSSSTHEAQQTAEGVVTGFYILRGANGEERRVDYVADKDGYRATITTNEIGTETHQSGDAVYMSSAPTPAELAARWQEEQDRQAGRQGGQPDQTRGPTPLTRQGQPQQPRTTSGATTGRRRQPPPTRQPQPPRQPPPQSAATGTAGRERENRPNIEIITARSARLQTSPSRSSRLILEPSAAAAQNFGVKI